MAEGPKLYANKPKKAQLKQFQEQKRKDFSSPVSSSSSMAAQSSSQPLPPPQPPKESLARRYKFLWPMLLTVNLAIGAYLFLRTKKKDTDIENEVATPVSITAAATAHVEKPLPSPIIKEPTKLREPISENQQRELFKWLLEEKRKVRPKDPEEKKRIDEEKSILKHFIRAKSVPSI